MDDDLCEAVLGDEASTSPEWGGEDRPVAVDHVIRRLAREGKDEVVVEAGAPVAREKGHLGCATTVGLVDGGADGAHEFRRVEFLGTCRDLRRVGKDRELSVEPSSLIGWTCTGRGARSSRRCLLWRGCR